MHSIAEIIKQAELVFHVLFFLIGVQFSFTEDDFRTNEPDGFLPVLVSKSARIASRVELVVVPLTVQEARAASLPLPPNIPDDNPRSPPFAGKKKFWVHIMRMPLS